MPRRRFEQAIVDAANRCILNLESDALWSQLPSSDLEYTCGAMAMRWLDGTPRARSRGGSLLLEALGATLRDARRGQYGTEDLLSHVRAIAGDDATTAVSELLHSGFAHPDTRAAAELRRVGAPARVVSLSAGGYSPSAMDALARISSRCACRRRKAFARSRDGLQLEGTADCGPVHHGQTVRAVGELRLPEEAPQALALAAAAWSRGEPVLLSVSPDESDVSVSCPAGTISVQGMLELQRE